MRIASAQFDIHWNNPQANLGAAFSFAKKAQNEQAEMLLLPETFSTGFSLLDADAALKVGQETEAGLLEISSQVPITIAGSFLSQAPSGKPWNQLIVAKNGAVLGRYSKLHLFGYGGENERFQRGAGPLTLTLSGLRFSFFICYDLRFPVCWSRLAPSTDVFVVVANWPKARVAHWRALLIARAIENQAFVIGLNRIGQGGGLEYNGQSLYVSPRGEILQEGGSSEHLMLGDFDIGQVTSYRSEFPCLKDRVHGIDD